MLLYLKEETKMSGSGFVKGMVTGAVVGAVTMMVFDPISTKQRKRMRRQTNHVFRNIGSMVDGIADMRK